MRPLHDVLINSFFQTTNELWQECVVDASVKTVYKVSVAFGEDIIDTVTKNHE